MSNAINWFEIPAVDMNRAIRFWEAVLSTTLARETMPGVEMAVFPHEGGTGGALVRREQSVPAASGTLVYLDTGRDLDGAIARAKEAGGKIAVPRTEIGKDGAFAVVVDSEGNTVGLHAETRAS